MENSKFNSERVKINSIHDIVIVTLITVKNKTILTIHFYNKMQLLYQNIHTDYIESLLWGNFQVAYHKMI